MTIVQLGCIEAARRFDRHDNRFTTANFQSAFSRVTDSRPMVTSAQVEAILFSTPGVRPDGLCHWRFETPALNSKPVKDPK